MGIKSGKLRHRINIETPVNSQDSETGEVTTEWQVLHEKIAASIEPLSARDFIAAQSKQSTITARIGIRYIAGLTPVMRIVHNGIIYYPAAWLPDLESGREYLTAPVSRDANLG